MSWRLVSCLKEARIGPSPPWPDKRKAGWMIDDVNVSNIYKVKQNFDMSSINCYCNISQFSYDSSLLGSVTLHQWQQLAIPNLGGILHPRPGVLTKDFKELEVDIQHVYSLNDLEEDELDLSNLSEVHGLGMTSINTKCKTSLSVLISPSCFLDSYMQHSLKSLFTASSPSVSHVCAVCLSSTF